MLFQFRDAHDKVTTGDWSYRDGDDTIYYGIDFEVKPLFDDQTFTGRWEGLCDMNGGVVTSRLVGMAFIELTGY